ncbi:MAG TPA: putative baseplate assembly protein [Chloroflexia bacterium]|nr:putative baseplate assembly protein [Chloroflexia bacterium]
MVLPSPKLDDRTFQDLVNETKRLIPRYCPEWTDHNVSDPGVTMIELFAYMVDILLYRVNRVPERNYIKWLEMLGLRLLPPRPARTDITIYLTGPQPDAVTIPMGTQVGTVRTESQNAIVFSTDTDRTIYVPTVSGILVKRGQNPFSDYMQVMENPVLNLGIFQDPPQPNDALYFGYHEDLSGHILRISLKIPEIEGTGVIPEDPPIAWEFWDGREWIRAFKESDTTRALNQDGDVVLHIPYNAKPRDIDGHVAFWIRLRATSPEEQRKQRGYSAAPRIDDVHTESLGGIVPASQVESIENEVIGRSTGQRGQEWPLSYSPVIERRAGEYLEVQNEKGEYIPWQEVDDFGGSKPGDLHYTLDSHTGMIRFGPTIRDAGGREIQYGTIPEAGAQMRFTKYRTGGGLKGNVGKNSVTILKSSIPYVAEVRNAAPAIGGEDAETLEMLMVRGPQMLRARSRAVTTEDYEYLAIQATPEVARARTIPPTPEEVASGKGVIKVLLVPESDRTDSPIPPPELRLGERALEEIMVLLNERRIVTSEVKLDAPPYRFVSVEVDVTARKRTNKEALDDTITRKLYTLINPVNGGPDGEGWPWGRSLYHSEITSLVQGVDGVEYVEAVRFFVIDTVTGTRSKVDGTITCPPNGLLASFNHAVNVK